MTQFSGGQSRHSFAERRDGLSRVGTLQVHSTVVAAPAFGGEILHVVRRLPVRLVQSFCLQFLSVFDQVNIEEVRQKYYDAARARNLPTQAESLKRLSEEGVWTSEDEAKIKEQENFLEAAEKTKKQYYLKAEIEKANEDIDLVISKIKRKIKNTKLDMCPYITGHDFWVFVSRYGGGTEFFDYVDKLDISRVLYLSTTTEKSLRIATLNTMIKNQNKGYDNYIEFIDRYGESKLEQYKNEAKIYLDSKRDCDIILEVECIYDKEYLRNFLKNNYVSWSDTNYDVLYDYYMSKQPLSI